MTDNRARHGWESDFPTFRSTPPARVSERLRAYVGDASPEQVRAWADAIPSLQQEVDEVLVRDVLAKEYSAILEYELPMEARRPDVLLLVGAGVMVVELKGRLDATQADIDQASAYARDLRCYHRECAERDVVPVLVPTRARGYVTYRDGVHITGPDALDGLISEISSSHPGPAIDRARFLDETAYCPLPTLVEAARELFRSGTLRKVKRGWDATQPSIESISRIIHQASLTQSRHLILVTGVPGAGKTLVGLRTVHAHYLDDLAVPRAYAKPTVPAVFLSGNGPLVEVLQYELREAGGAGKTFVRGVKDYVSRYSRKPGLVPPEHVLVFDEAQRAFDANKVAETHRNGVAKSEPEHFVDFAERIPEWCVVIGLIGSGQEIHVGEEGGLVQWRWAVERSSLAGDWTVHGPPEVEGVFANGRIPFESRPELHLDCELRYHRAEDIHRFVAALLAGEDAETLAPIAEKLAIDGFHLRMTRTLSAAKQYLRDRYRDDPDARFGLIASSKDRDLVDLGVPNDFQSTKRVRFGPWYGDSEDDYSGRSCRRLETCVTEFGAQGLELDATLLAWGTDLMRENGRWSNARARGYKAGAKVRDPFQLRINAYRVLLTRGRDACVVFVPPLAELDETNEYLTGCGFGEL